MPVRTKKPRASAVPMRLEARRHLIMEAIATGERYVDMVRRFSTAWNLSEGTVEQAIKEALAFMRSESTKENLVAMNLQRLDAIATDSMKDKDRKNAIRAIDVQNRLAGGYEDKVRLEGDSEINLVFEL